MIIEPILKQSAVQINKQKLEGMLRPVDRLLPPLMCGTIEALLTQAQPEKESKHLFLMDKDLKLRQS